MMDVSERRAGELMVQKGVTSINTWAVPAAMISVFRMITFQYKKGRRPAHEKKRSTDY